MNITGVLLGGDSCGKLLHIVFCNDVLKQQLKYLVKLRLEIVYKD